MSEVEAVASSGGDFDDDYLRLRRPDTQGGEDIERYIREVEALGSGDVWDGSSSGRGRSRGSVAAMWTSVMSAAQLAFERTLCEPLTPACSQARLRHKAISVSAHA